MKLVKNSDITLTVDGNGVPIFFEPVRSQQNGKMCFALKATNSVTFVPLRCSSPISSGYFVEKHLKGPKVFAVTFW